MLEEIITPSALIPSVHDTDLLHQFLESLPLSDWNFGHLVERIWVHALREGGNSLRFMADVGGTCPTTPTPTGDLPPLVPFDPFGLTQQPAPIPGIDFQSAFDTLTPPVVLPFDPPGSTPKIQQVNPGDFPLANHPVIGIIDTGFSNNPDIDNSRQTLGRDRVSNDDNPILSAGEGNEHGTFVEGIIGATRNNGIGIDGINDRAPMWVGRAIGSGKWAESLREFVDAVKKSGQPNGLVNLSLDLTQQNPDGSVTTRYEFTPEERSALEYARQNHVLIVAAAGNDGGVMSVLGQASQEFDNIMTVGAADGKNRAAYSSYGRGLDILAAGGTPEKPEWSTVGDGVGTMAGTSVATAKVTGAASLVWAANPGLNYRQVVEILKSTAMDLSVPGWDEETGAGLLDIEAAVEKAKVTKPEVYNPEDFLTLTTGIRGGQVTPQERAVQVHQVQNPWGRRFYYGWLNNSNRMDRFDFTMTSKKLVQFSLKDGLGSDFLEAQVSLYDDYGNRYPVNQPNSNSSLWNVTLYPGNYHLHVDKGSRYEIDPYKLTLNFNENNNITALDESIWLPRPVISQDPVFTNPGGSQVTVPVQPPVDWQKIAEEQAKAELLKKQQEEAAAKAAAEASAKAAAEAAAKAAAEAEQRRRSEAEENARKAIALASEQNKSWLGNSFNDVQIDWNTLLSSRVAAIRYFDGGYVVWNGVHAVAYQTGSGNSNSSTNLTPIEVRLHDLGMQYGRHEYGQYVGFANRQDYYKFTVEKIGDYYPQDLLFALRSNGVDIPLTDATIEILDAQLNPVPLSQVWQANGQPGLSILTGATYYMRVKPAKNNLNYGLTLNLDSAQESLGTARPLSTIKGRQQFRDFVGNKGDGLGDYYSFSVEHPSLLQFSLSELDAGADANVELLDSNGNILPPDLLSGKVGAKKFQPGTYYLRVIPANNTNTNYTLTMQIAEDLGTYTGRHEYKDRIIGGEYREAYYRLNVDAPAEELQLALRNLSGDVNVELLRDNGSGIVNSTLISPVTGSNQSGTQSEYKAYSNIQPGHYLVRTYLPDSSTPAAKYDLVMNLDQAGENWSSARNLGMLTDIAQLSDYQFSDFVGADKGDGSDVYKFQVGDYGLVHLALKPQAGDAEANMLAGNMRLQDESGKDVDLLNVNTGKDVNYAAAYLQPGKSYYLTVSSNRGMMTNYNLVINPNQGGNDWASARDLGVIKDGQPNKADNDEDYKLQEFVGYLNGNVDGADFYKFTLDERNVMTFGLGGLSAPTHIQLFNAANPSKSIDFSQLVYETPNLDKRVSVELGQGTYYLKLFPDERLGKQGTNYSLAVNAELVPANSGGGADPLLKVVDQDYFLARPQFYTIGNIFYPAWAPSQVNGTSGHPGNCTWYANGRVKELGGSVTILDQMGGDAGTWHNHLPKGASLVNDPQPGDIAEWEGHVAVVEKVDRNLNGSVKSITLSQSSWSGPLHSVWSTTPSDQGVNRGWPDYFIRVPGVSVGSDNNSGNSQSQSDKDDKIHLVNFQGTVMIEEGSLLLMGPSVNADSSGVIKQYEDSLNFDAWGYGDPVNDHVLGTPDYRWFRIAGTNYWIPSAEVKGNPPGSSRPIPSGSNSNYSGAFGPFGAVTIGAIDPLTEALEFIKKIELENSSKSVYDIANILRGYTRDEYRDGEWTLVTNLSDPGKLGNQLNNNGLTLSGKLTDFGHFIASLSDQIMSPSAIANLSGDLTSWAGDIGSAVVDYRKQGSKTMQDALQKFCPDADYTADIAACVVGYTINSNGRKGSIADAIRKYDQISYSENVKMFIEKILGGTIEGNTLKNPADVEARIRISVAAFVTAKAFLTLPNGDDLFQGSLDFLSYLVRQAGLNNFNFQPYQDPSLTILGTVKWEQSVPV